MNGSLANTFASCLLYYILRASRGGRGQGGTARHLPIREPLSDAVDQPHGHIDAEVHGAHSCNDHGQPAGRCPREYPGQDTVLWEASGSGGKALRETQAWTLSSFKESTEPFSSLNPTPRR